MQIVFITNDYIDYLYQHENRVCFNKGGKRPYIGVVFQMQEHEYFAPLTSHGKGNYLKKFPKQEDLTFLPINDCRHGGINFNNMIPVVAGVYRQADFMPNKDDNIKQIKYKKLLQIQWQFIARHKKEIRQKASVLYNLKTKKHLPIGADARTCDFKVLEPYQ